MAFFRKLNTGWQFRISYKENGEYKEKSKRGFKTKKEAEIAAAAFEAKLHKGVDINAGDRLFAEYYSDWVETYKKGKFSPETDAIYQTAENLVNEYFPDYKLKQMTKTIYQKFLNEYAEDHAKETVRKMHNKIGACLREAFRNGDISKDITYKVHIGGYEGKKESEKYLHEYEAKKLLKALNKGLRFEYVSRYIAILQLATGARIGELLGLTFDSFDFEKGTLKIEKAWDYKRKTGFKPTKGKETRIIGIDETTINLIKPFYDHIRKKSLSGPLPNEYNLVFTNNYMEALDPASINNMLERSCKRAKVPRITSHHLRHTHASILLLHGVELQYVSERLGHKDMTTTAQVYAHVLKEARQKGDDQTKEIAASLYG